MGSLPFLFLCLLILCDACDSLVNGSLPVRIKGESLFCSLGLIGSLKLCYIDVIEADSQLFQLFHCIRIGLVEEVALVFNTFLNSSEERLAEIFGNPIPCVVAHAEEDVHKRMLRIGDVLGHFIVTGVVCSAGNTSL